VPKRRSELRDDHVMTRRSILACLASPGADVEATLRSVISCTVTKAEHERLTKFDDTCAGWDRYMAARIDVYDMATGTLFIQDGQYTEPAYKSICADNALRQNRRPVPQIDGSVRASGLQ
jgi:hypothetical protein